MSTTTPVQTYINSIPATATFSFLSCANRISCLHPPKLVSFLSVGRKPSQSAFEHAKSLALSLVTTIRQQEELKREQETKQKPEVEAVATQAIPNRRKRGFQEATAYVNEEEAPEQRSKSSVLPSVCNGEIGPSSNSSVSLPPPLPRPPAADKRGASSVSMMPPPPQMKKNKNPLASENQLDEEKGSERGTDVAKISEISVHKTSSNIPTKAEFSAKPILGLVDYDGESD